MAFDSLSNRLSGIPRVLAGPILRQVTATSVTVWIALREAQTSVTLTISDDQNKPLMKGNRSTIAIGNALHIVAVTAHPIPPFKGLTEGNIYLYNVDFGGGMDLAATTNTANLAYTPYSLPSFCLPPKNLDSVRLFHGSCRMPHGSGPDALALLDVLIGQAASNAQARPHQLLLMGDQIYADDVADSLLMLLTDAGDTLLNGAGTQSPNWTETLPGLNKPSKSLPPYWRTAPLQKAGFTSADLRSQLMSLGEYLAMYLFAWSDVLWPKDTATNSVSLPTVDDVMNAVDAGKGDSWVPPQSIMEATAERLPTIADDIRDVKIFHDTLFRVRKALANIPTYMIFDDHEVTDDWNMTLGFCKRVYNDPLARRVVQNALVAYNLCQHWGNVGEQFALVPPASTLLGLLNGTNDNKYRGDSAQIQKIVGVRTQAGQRDVDPGSIIYNYTIETLGYQVIVTDTRTWRTFPDGNNTSGHFLPVNQTTDQFKAQITDQPALNGRALLVVVTTNAPETEALRSATRHSFTSTHGSSIAQGDPHPDIYDSWELPGVPFDRLMARVINKLPLVNGKRHGWAILLSGDVHNSFASRLKYSATRSFETLEAANAVIAQLVASSLKKQTSATVDMHRQGYRWSIPGIGVPPLMAEGYVGYNSLTGVQVAIKGGTWTQAQKKNTFILGLGAFGLWEERFADPSLIKLSRVPDYRYRLDYIGYVLGGSQSLTPPSIPPVTAGSTLEARQQAAEWFNIATNYYRDLNRQPNGSQNIVGVNNITETTFETHGGDLNWAHHTVRFQNPDTKAYMWVTYSLNLDPTENTVYQDITALQEGP